MRASDFILETAEESQVLNAVANSVSEGIMRVLSENPGIIKRVLRTIFNPTAKAGDKATELTVMSLRPNQLGAPRTNVPSVDRMLNSIGITVNKKSGPKVDDQGIMSSTMGAYSPVSRRIELYLPSLYIKDIVDGQPEFRTYQEMMMLMKSTLVHEMQHALDDLNSDGRSMTKTPVSGIENREGYLRSQEEVSARFQEALMSIANSANNLKSIDLAPDMRDLPVLIKSAFKEHEIDRLMFKRPQQYNRLLNRAYKFFQAELQSPKQEAPQSTARRALNWILGRSTTQLR